MTNNPALLIVFKELRWFLGLRLPSDPEERK